MKRQLEDVLARAFTPVPATAAVEPEPSLGFDRVIQQAMVHAAMSSATHVDSGVLVFILREEESHAAHSLAGRRSADAAPRDFARADERQAGVPATGDNPSPPSSDPLEAYATNLVRARRRVVSIRSSAGRSSSSG